MQLKSNHILGLKWRNLSLGSARIKIWRNGRRNLKFQKMVLHINSQRHTFKRHSFYLTQPSVTLLMLLAVSSIFKVVLFSPSCNSPITVVITSSSISSCKVRYSTSVNDRRYLIWIHRSNRPFFVVDNGLSPGWVS